MHLSISNLSNIGVVCLTVNETLFSAYFSHVYIPKTSSFNTVHSVSAVSSISTICSVGAVNIDSLKNFFIDFPCCSFF